MRLLLLSVALAASPAFAQEGTMPDWANKSGSFGIGGNTTLGGVNGLNIRTYVTPLFGIHAILGFDLNTVSVDGGGAGDTSATTFVPRAGIYGSYKLAYWQRGHLSVLFGVDVPITTTSTRSPLGDSNDTNVDLLVGLGFMGEWFFSEFLSVFAQAGLRIDFLDDVTVETTPDLNDTAGIAIGLGTDLFGGAGFTVWFN